MEQIGPILVIALIFCLPGLVGAFIAGKKGRSKILWFFLSGILPLLIGVLLVLKEPDS